MPFQLDLSRLPSKRGSIEYQKEFQDISEYIRKHEGRKILKYNDTAKHPTIGIGHRIKPGEDFTNFDEEAAEKLFESDLSLNIAKTKDIFPKYDTYPVDIKKALVDGVFRGDYKKTHKTVKHINEGLWDKVPKEYINRKDYRKSKASEGTSEPMTGVYKRLDENAALFKGYGNYLKSPNKPQAFNFNELNPFYVGEAEAGQFKLDTSKFPKTAKTFKLDTSKFPKQPQGSDLLAKAKLAFQVGKTVIPKIIDDEKLDYSLAQPAFKYGAMAKLEGVPEGEEIGRAHV